MNDDDLRWIFSEFSPVFALEKIGNFLDGEAGGSVNSFLLSKKRGKQPPDYEIFTECASGLMIN